MENVPVQKNRIEHAKTSERISLAGYFQRKRSFFALFLICCALLVAAFAISYIWADGGADWIGGDPPPLLEGDGESRAPSNAETEPQTDAPTETESLGETQTDAPTEGETSGDGSTRTPIRTVELSAGAGVTYINNESIYLPNAERLLEADVSSPYTEEPLVLVLHTHTSEGYVEDGCAWIEGEVGDATYTTDASASVLAAGRVLCDTLRAKGIGAIHCTTSHDAKGQRGAYAASAESVRFFLSLYPSIRYVIDLHRDAILDADGAYLRAVSESTEGACAQVMAVVGSDGNGTPCENWEGNLSLALRLRQLLNEGGGSICRPVTLRNSSYNQELSPYSLLLEIGTGGNSVKEAERAAKLVGEALVTLILGT